MCDFAAVGFLRRIIAEFISWNRRISPRAGPQKMLLLAQVLVALLGLGQLFQQFSDGLIEAGCGTKAIEAM